ncbi:MAG: hypothetical protein IJA20_06920 [Methanocorpusculum sp.]|nr:hypothetical protein [Oscillospiraceae bacterium]MBQ3570388.1 hypothetical protein [Methanocorpusculum sp.]
MNQNDEHRYDDILHCPHHVSPTRPRMAIIDRAAQFAPFAALTGHDAAVKERARLTDDKLELDADALAALDEKLQLLRDMLPDCPEVTFTYFVADKKKAGGAYVQKPGHIKKFDDYQRAIVLTDKTIIPIEDVAGIDCEALDALLHEDGAFHV